MQQTISRPAWIALAALFAVVAAGRCQAQAVPPASPMQDVSANDSTGPDTQAMKDKIFLRKTAQGGIAEVQFGQLALQRTASEDVRKFAQRMVDDHTMLNNNIKPIAESLGVRLPTDLSKGDKAEYTRLASLSGADFDKEYLTVMSRDHHQDLKSFEDEEASAHDPDLKEAVSVGTRVIAKHARMADRLAAANGAPVAPPVK